LRPYELYQGKTPKNWVRKTTEKREGQPHPEPGSPSLHEKVGNIKRKKVLIHFQGGIFAYTGKRNVIRGGTGKDFFGYVTAWIKGIRQFPPTRKNASSRGE